MKHEKCQRLGNPARIVVVTGLMALGGCAAWKAPPARVEANYGASVRNMVFSQIANPDKARHPAAEAPDGLDGVKAESVLDKAYRKDAGDPKRVRQHSTFGLPGLSSGTGSATQ